MDNAQRTVTVINVICFIQITSAIREVNKCPLKKTAWTARASNLRCDSQSGLSYHCIKDHGYNLIEACLMKQKITSGRDGCPWVYIEPGGSVIFGAVNTKCEDRNSCPLKNHTGYYTDQLYEYPGCIRMDSSKTTTTTTIPCSCTTETKEKELMQQGTVYNILWYSSMVCCFIIGFLVRIPNIKKERKRNAKKLHDHNDPDSLLMAKYGKPPDEEVKTETETKGLEERPTDEEVKTETGMKSLEEQHRVEEANTATETKRLEVFTHDIFLCAAYLVFIPVISYACFPFNTKEESRNTDICLLVYTFFGSVVFSWLLVRKECISGRTVELSKKMFTVLFNILVFIAIMKILEDKIAFINKYGSSGIILSMSSLSFTFFFFILQCFFHLKLLIIVP